MSQIANGSVATFKSIQRGIIDMTGSIQTATATVTAVTIGKARLTWLGVSNDGTTAQTGDVTLVLTNATTITATRLANATGSNCNVSWELTDYF